MVNKKNDLTRIEDLTDFDHEEDPETDAILEKAKSEHTTSEKEENDQDLLEASCFDEETGTIEKTDLSDLNDDTFEEPFENEPETIFEQQDEDDDDADNQAEALFVDEESESHETDQDFTLEETEDEAFDFEEPTEGPLEVSDPANDLEEHQNFERPQTVDEINLKEEIIPEDQSEFPVSPPSSLPEIKKDLHKSQDLQDINQFANKKVFAKVISEGSPAFSIKLSNIKFVEDAQDILQILNEHQFITKTNEKVITDGLFSGNAIISHISEFAAITLYHKFRRFDLIQEMGPAEKLYTTQTYENDNLSPVSKRELFQNFSQEETPTVLSKELKNKVFCSVSDQVENLTIVDYLGMSSVTSIIDSSSISPTSSESFDQIYKSLQDKLMDKAQKKNANGIINLSYNINHIEIDNTEKFQVICSGNIVKFIEK